MEQFLNTLKDRLQQPLPGPDAQYRMAPVARARFDTSRLKPEDYKPSAVMLLLCRDGQGSWFLPLTLRPSYKGAHSGQVSLPGGKFDASDSSLENTARRECYEEIGIKDDVQILGSLTKLYIPVSNFLVEPFLGVYTMPDPVFIPHEREVKSIVKLRLEELMNADTIRQGPVAIDGSNNLRIEAPYFLSGEYKIWGATAMMLSELKALLEPIF